MAPSNQDFCVRAVQCDYRSSDEEIYQSLKRAVDPLARAWEKLEKARRVVIKFNQEGPPGEIVYHQGQRQQLVGDPVTRAVLRLLRERTRAELLAVDVGVIRIPEGETRRGMASILPVLEEFGVPYIDGTIEPVQWVDVPGGGQMFQRYPVPQAAAEADEIISVQKLKNHLFMGVTLCLKNLFGLMPVPPDGRPRTYYHHLVRMPYMLADLGKIYNPALNILDGLVCQAGEEWGKGEHPRICNTLIAGDQVVATDACAARLMGHDPAADWLTPPFHRDRNALVIAAEAGLGTLDPAAIDFQSEVQAPVGAFFAKELDPRPKIISWRRTTAEQALYYRDHWKEIAGAHAGKYILLQQGQVRWSDASGDLRTSRRVLSGKNPEQAMWLKWVDPEEAEGEQYQVYEDTLRDLQARGL